MPQIPMYQQQTQAKVSTPSKQGGVDVSSGSRALAQGVANASNAYVRVEDQKAQLIAENKKLETEAAWAEKERQLQDNIKNAPAPQRLKLLNQYSQEAAKMYGEGMAAAMDGMTNLEQRHLKSRLDPVKYRAMERAAVFEATQKGTAQKELFIDNNTHYQNKVYTNADEYDTQKQEVLKGVTALNIDPKARGALQEELLEDLGVARATGRIYEGEYESAEKFLLSQEAKENMRPEVRHRLLMSVKAGKKVSGNAQDAKLRREVEGYIRGREAGNIKEADPQVLLKAAALDEGTGAETYSKRVGLADNQYEDAAIAVSGTAEEIAKHSSTVGEIAKDDYDIGGDVVSRDQQFRAAVSRARTEELKDPALYASTNSETVRNSVDKRNKMIEAGASEAEIAAQSQLVIEETLAFQDGRGVPKEHQRIVPDPERLENLAKLADSTQDFNSMVATMASMKLKYGDHFYRAYSEMAGDMDTTTLAMFTTDDPTTIELLASNAGFKLTDSYTTSELNSLKSSVSEEFAEVKATMVRQPGGVTLANKYEAAMLRLSALYEKGGQSQTDAIATAKNSLFSSYDYRGAARIPKQHGGVTVDTEAVIRGLDYLPPERIAAKLGVDPPPGLEGLGDKNNYYAMVDMAKGAYYQTAPDESGLMMYVETGTATGRGSAPLLVDGEPLIIPWDTLSSYGDAGRRRATEGSRTANLKSKEGYEIYEMNKTLRKEREQ